MLFISKPEQKIKRLKGKFRFNLCLKHNGGDRHNMSEKCDVKSYQVDEKSNSDPRMKEFVKSEKELDDISLRHWTEPCDSKYNLVLPESFTNKLSSDFKEEDYEVHSDEDNQDSVVTGKTRVKTIKKKYRSKIDQVLEELCKDAPVSEKIHKMCLFSCPDCKTEFSQWRTLVKHQKSSQQCRRVFMMDINYYAKDITCYVCRICCEKVPCDYVFLRRHTIRQHCMPIGEYVKKFDKGRKKMPKPTYSDKYLGNLCVHKCEDCNGQFNSSQQLYKHQAISSHKSKTKKNVQFVKDCLPQMQNMPQRFVL